MKTDPRFIFGIRTNEAVSLSITADGPLPQQPPDLRIKTSEQDITIPCSSNAWCATLDAGDYIAYVLAPDDSRFDVRLTFTLSTPATIVSSTGTGTTKVLRTWTATGGTNDSKNPWPPPLDGNADITSLPNSTWLSSTLTAMMAEVSIARSDSADVPPAGTVEPFRSH